MAADFVLEACVDSLDSALAAKEGGATRLELCANLLIGGTTPMPSLVRRVKAATGLPTHALLRPRFGDFLYTGEEFSLLLEDAAALLEAGADAIVSGFLTPAGDLDRQRLAQLVELCHREGKRFTLHRAFDMCRDPFAALELCKELGVDTVLTSGQKNTCLEGLPLLEELWPRRGGVELLLGAGISAAAIRRIRESLPQARAFHMSGKITVESPMSYRKGDVSMGLPGFDEYTLWRTDPENRRAARTQLTDARPGPPTCRSPPPAACWPGKPPLAPAGRRCPPPWPPAPGRSGRCLPITTPPCPSPTWGTTARPTSSRWRARPWPSGRSSPGARRWPSTGSSRTWPIPG